MGVGISGGADPLPIPGANGTAFAFSARLRAGVQVDDLLSVYYQGGIGGGAPFAISLGGGGFGPILQVVHTSAILGEVTLWNAFQFALGPSVGIGSERRASTGDSLLFGAGLSARVGLTATWRGAGTRQGISIATQLDVIVLPEGRVLVIATQTVGLELF